MNSQYGGDRMGQTENRLDPALLFPSFRLAIYECTFQPLHPLKSLTFYGSTWRGAFGWALKYLCCPWGTKTKCAECRVSATCAYSLCYEKKSDEPGFRNPPRPYILNPLPIHPTNTLVRVRLTLIGSAAEHAATVLAALGLAGKRGIGKRRIPCMLQRITRVLPDGRHVGLETSEGKKLRPSSLLSGYLHDEGMPPPPWRIELLHPLRIRKNGRPLTSLDWPETWKSFAIRMAIFSRLYNEGERLSSDSWQALLDFLAKPGKSQDHVSEIHLSRYSNRQHKQVPLDGSMAGESLLTLPTDRERLWWRWWQAAELLHMGKGADMGMGWIRLGSPLPAHREHKALSISLQEEQHGAHFTH